MIVALHQLTAALYLAAGVLAGVGLVLTRPTLSRAAVAGWGQEEDRLRAVAAGFDHHLVKPISADTVETLLHSLPRGTTA